MSKRLRQQRILSLLRNRRISTQDELRAELERSGFPATQSSISRDLIELDIVKRHGIYTAPHESNGANPRGLVGLERAGDSLVVAKCDPGLASAVAVEIDRARLEEVVGTLAGEDTVFIAVRERGMQNTAIRKIWEVFD